MTTSPSSFAASSTRQRGVVGARRRSAVAILLSGVLALTACQNGDAEQAGSSEPEQAATQNLTLLLDWAPNPDHVALYTAEHLGAYEEQGVDVEFRTPSNTADAAREVSLGRADLAVSYEPDTLIALSQDLDVIPVAALIPTALTSVVSWADNPIESGQDMEGKTVGISGLASQLPTLAYIAREAGIDPESITTPNLQQSLGQAILSKQVDAIFGAFRNIEGIELSEQGDFTIVPVTDFGVPDYAELVIIANPTRLAEDDAYAERVRKFLAGTAEGQQAAVADPALAVTALEPVTKGSYDPVLLEKMVDATLGLLPAQGFGEQSADDWATYATWMHDNGLLEAEVDGAAATTNDLLPTEGS